MSGPHKFIIDEWHKDTALFFAKLSGAAYYTPKAFTHFLRKEEIVDHWFSVLCNTIAEEQTPMKQDTQIVKEEKREDGKTEIS